MSCFCYVCAYMRPDRPLRQDRLPNGSLAPADIAPLGDCFLCSVRACSLHGTRYQTFKCAICTPAQAVKTAFEIADDEVASELALAAGGGGRVPLPSLVVRDRLEGLQSPSGREAVISRLLEEAPRSRWSVGDDRFGLPDDDPRAVAAAIRSAFTRERLSLRDDAAEIVTGAITSAHLLADPSYRDSWRAPWTVTYPRLIDPVIWLVQAAVSPN